MIHQGLTCQRMEQFTEYLQVTKAALILKAILEARSPRLSDLSQVLPGKPEANYKMSQRFLKATEPREALWRLCPEETPFILADPTEIRRPQAKRTSYVGTLSDGKTRGFCLLVLAAPYRGRAIPFSFVSYSSRTIAQQSRSRNAGLPDRPQRPDGHQVIALEHNRALGEVAELVLDHRDYCGYSRRSLARASVVVKRHSTVAFALFRSFSHASTSRRILSMSGNRRFRH